MAQKCVQLGNVGCGVFGVPLHADNGGIDRLDGLDRSVGSVSADLKAFGEACDALVVEAFGLGGIPEYDGITETLLAWVDAGKTLVMTTQCPYEGADLSVYEVGRAFCDRPGVLMGGSATTEALLAKTMWALAQAADLDGVINREQLAELFASC